MEGLRDCDTVTLAHYDKFEEPCKFVSKDFDLLNHDYIKNRLTQNTGFLVVGVIGKQTVGKSFILNMLANNYDKMESKPFETSTIHDMLNFSQKTVGVDMHVTSDRVILLDSQCILNTNHLGVSMEKEKKIKVYSNDDSENEGKIKMAYSPDILTVQVISYFLSVCHVVLIVDDHVVNYRLLRLVDLAHRLKPWIGCNPSHLPLDEARNMLSHGDFYDEFHDYVAQMVFVENMCPVRDTSKEQMAEYVSCINQVMVGYRSRADEQNALHGWLKELRQRQSVRHNSHLRRKLQEQREKLHNNASNVVQLEGARSENGSEEEVITVQTVEETPEVSLTIADEAMSDHDDDEIAEKRLNRSIHRPIKLVRMPLFEFEDPRFEQESRSFQQTIFGLPRKHFCVTQSERFTELCWLDYASDMWQNIKNSQIFSDYFYSYSNLLLSDL